MESGMGWKWKKRRGLYRERGGGGGGGGGGGVGGKLWSINGPKLNLNAWCVKWGVAVEEDQKAVEAGMNSMVLRNFMQNFARAKFPGSQKSAKNENKNLSEMKLNFHKNKKIK